MRRTQAATAALATLLFLSAGPALAAGEEVAVLTPYLSSVATNDMITAFEAEAESRGWSVNVVDTRGDFGALANRLEDVVNAGVDAIVVVSIDPAQVQDQISAAAAAGIPVVAIDGRAVEGVTLNVTSDNFALGRMLSDYVIEQIGGAGSIVKFYHSAHPGVRQRELALDEALAAHPEVTVVAEHYVQVPGPIDDARTAMESILQAHPADTIDAVWAAWDEPAIGALLALQAAGAEDAGVVIAGIDANPQAVELIGQCTPLLATVRQDFAAMARLAAEQLDKVFAGGEVDAAELYAPGSLVTRETLGAQCG